MNRLFFLLTSLVLTLAALPAQGKTKPNVVLIISDDQAWGDYSLMGHKHIKTPHLDKLARESLTFARGYTPVPLCRPSLATIISGKYPHRHGVVGNDPDLPKKGTNAMAGRGNPEFAPIYESVIASFRKEQNLVRDLVKNHGYLALQTGKWWEGNPVEVGGFTEAMTHGDPKRGGRHGDAGLQIGRTGLKPITDFIEKSGKEAKPFALWYAPFLPHTPHTPPKALFEKYKLVAPSAPVAKYWAMCEWFDQTCGDLLGYLDKNGLRENTIVIYCCDNGWIQDPKRANRFADRSKQSPYEGGVRTPLMIRWPGQVKAEINREILASTVDIVPTLRDCLGLPAWKDLPGISWKNRKALEERSAVYGEAFAHNIAKVGEPSRSLKYRWMIDGWHKIIVPQKGLIPDGKIELFDLKNDPDEKKNLAAAKPEEVKRLTALLDAWWKP